VSVRENQIDLEAFRWVVLIEDGPLPAEQQCEFETWLALAPKHRGAFIRARAASLHFDRVGALAAGRGVLDPQPNWSRRKLISAAVSATSFVGVGAWLGRQWIEDAWRGERYVSSVGQVLPVALPDGSKILLNTATEIFVLYGRNRREIRLARGEALFTVALAMQPFTVQVGEWIVRAASAVFAVHQGSVMNIAVTEGNVELLSADSSATREPQRLVANQEALVDASGVRRVLQVSDTELRRRLAWRTGMVVFDGQPLHAVLAEMNRYSARQIVCDDPTLCERRIVGVIGMTDMETFVSMLETQFGVEVVPEGTTVHLRSRAK
jgi:transmembrane sensor